MGINKELDDQWKRNKFQFERGKMFLKNQRYLVEVQTEGFQWGTDNLMVEESVEIRSMNLDELVQNLEFLHKPYKTHPVGLTEQEIEEFPYEKYEWGINKSVRILQQTEEEY